MTVNLLNYLLYICLILIGIDLIVIHIRLRKHGEIIAQLGGILKDYLDVIYTHNNDLLALNELLRAINEFRDKVNETDNG